MNRRIALLAGLGLLAWAIGLVAMLPAARAVGWFASDGVDAAGVTGTVWRGRAARVDAGGRVALTGVDWELAAWPLLAGRLAADTRFRMAGIEGQGRIVRRPGGALAVHELSLDGPVDRLGGLLPGIPLALRGNLLGHLAALSVGDGRLERLDGRLEWSAAEVVAPFRLGLGTVRAEATPADARPGYRVRVSGEGGGLDIAGDVRIEPDGRYRADLRLTPTASAPGGLSDMLGLAAQREGDTYRLRRSGRIPLPGG